VNSLDFPDELKSIRLLPKQDLFEMHAVAMAHVDPQELLRGQVEWRLSKADRSVSAAGDLRIRSGYVFRPQVP